MTDPAEDRITIDWSFDHRSCTARVTAARGEALVLRFEAPDPVVDPIARLRMEQAAYDTAARLLDL